MRKKLFAIVMSMTMVASFMPSLAFAAHTCVYPMGWTTGTVTWDAVQAALKTDDAKYIEVVKEPTHSENGTVKLTCKEDYCNEVSELVTVTDAANHATEKYVDKDMTLEQYADAMVAQKSTDPAFANKTKAANWVKTKEAANICYIKNVKVCPCGLVVEGTGTEMEHSDLNKKYDCVDYSCAKCGKTVKATAEHVYDQNVGTTVVEQANCGHGSGYAAECVCGAKGIHYDGGNNGLAHNYGSTVKTEDATLKSATAGQVVVKSGYVGVNGSNVKTFTNAGTAANGFDPTGYTFYKLNNVKTEATTCGSSKVMNLVCATCGKAVVGSEETSTAVAHDYVETKVPATCDSRSKVKKVCKVCGNETEENATTNDDTKAHSYKVTKVAATCADAEYYTIKCSTCAKDCDHAEGVKIENDGTVTAAPGLYSNVTLKSEDTTAKTKTFIYTGFNNELKGTSVIEVTISTVPAGSHKWGTEGLLKAATCTTDEVWGQKCVDCGKLNTLSVYTKSNTRLGHDLVEVKTPATCGEAGTIAKACSRCDYEVAPVNDPAAKPVVKDGAKCTFDKWVVTKDSTVFEEGVKSLECSVCGADGNAKTVIAKKTVAKASNTVKAGKKSFNVKSSAANATGYRVYYKKAGAKSWKSYTKKTTSLSKTFSGLSKGKYYVKVKAYAKNYDGDGQVVWGATSSTKSVKVK